MNALQELFALGLGLYERFPWKLSTIGSLALLAFTAYNSHRLYRSLQEKTEGVAPGPVFVFSALVVLVGYLALLVYFALLGKGFEAGLLYWAGSGVGLPLEAIGGFLHPMMWQVLQVVFFAIYLFLVRLFAWLLGVSHGGDGSGSVARAVESEFATSYAMQFFRLCGYHRPHAPELRFHAYGQQLVRASRWAKWLSLPAVMTGGLSAAAWICFAILHDACVRNLTAPPVAPKEEEREEDEEIAAPIMRRDPNLLITALSKDARGPQVNVLGGGTLAARSEHSAEHTRVRDESGIMRQVLEALGVEDFYVHQEAASEAVLGGKDVLMETPPLSGRRTLGDVLAMREVLLEGGTVLYLSPNEQESRRRAAAFSKVAQSSNWRWAIFHHELGSGGRGSLDLRLRQPQIVFTTPAGLHDDLCALHGDWDYFLQSLALCVAVDMDRYIGPRGSHVAFLMRRLQRVVAAHGGALRFLTTVAPYGPDVQGFVEQLVGRPLTVIGPESDSRGAPLQRVIVGVADQTRALHPAVAARGVGIVCGYPSEVWGHEELLTDFEQQQQVNEVLLQFSRAVVSPGDGSDLRFEHAACVVVRMSSRQAAMLPFFTRHVGRVALGVAKLSAREVGERGGGDAGPQLLPFSGFERSADGSDLGDAERSDALQEELEQAPEDKRAASSELGEDQVQNPVDASTAEQLGDEGQNAVIPVPTPESAVAVWLADDDAFAKLLARHPQWIHPRQLHAMMALGSRLVLSVDCAAVVLRQMLAAAAELPLSKQEAAELFGVSALEAMVAGQSATSQDEPAEDVESLKERLREQQTWSLDVEGRLVQKQQLTLDGEFRGRGSTAINALTAGRLVNRAGGEHIAEVDAVRLGTTFYPGRVLVKGGRRYRVLMPDEQNHPAADTLYAEPERRRLRTQRVRRLVLGFEGDGHALQLGGSESVRYHHAKVQLREEVLGRRQSRRGTSGDELLLFDEAVVASYSSRAALLQLPDCSDAACEGLKRLLRVVLPAFVQHTEDDLDVVSTLGTSRWLAVVDRHPGGAGYARAVSSEVLRHALYWGREIIRHCRGEECLGGDGCADCVYGGPGLDVDTSCQPSRKATGALLSAILGDAS